LAHDAGPVVDEGVVDWRFAGMARPRDVWREVVKQSRVKSVLRCMMASGVEVAALLSSMVGREGVRYANALCFGIRVSQMRLMLVSVPSSALQGLHFPSASLGRSSFFHALVMSQRVGQNANIYLQRPLLSIHVNYPLYRKLAGLPMNRKSRIYMNCACFVYMSNSHLDVHNLTDIRNQALMPIGPLPP
jgi:hypothetical protein